MKINNKGFSLVELLVVITILAIISVVAYQNFGGATDKAIASRKINDIWTIETALQQFKADNNYYPMPMEQSSTNLWWYTWATTANPSNTLQVTYNWKEIASIVSWSGWWVVYGTWLTNSWNQIWAKWVIWYTSDFTKKYLSKELYDPELWDIKVWGTAKMMESWIWRYIYAIYAQPKIKANWNKQWTSWTYYNIATSLKKKDSDSYETYLVWDYDKNSCSQPSDCPESLIWTASWIINPSSLTNTQNQDLNKTTLDLNQWIPYPIKDFAN